MLVHGGRQVRIGPVLFWIVVGTSVIMAVWSIATGTYFAFHDDVLTRLVGRQAEMQFAYEDRIAELRAQVDRITSRQLLDQEQFEQKLNALLQRQAVIEQRATILTNDGLTTGSIRSQDRLRPSDRPAIANCMGAGLDRSARAGIRFARRGRAAAERDAHQPRGKLRQQDAAHPQRARRSRRHSREGAGGIGGPFVPLKRPARAPAASSASFTASNVARAQINQYAQTLTAVPVRKPVNGEVDMSSPFGMRLDPFLGRPAIHTGVDLRGEIGEPARATATGKVTIAGWDGGYGNMVEIDHGNGLATRYGHLSKILVKVGQFVRIGETVGLIGSTGRSTGPHLHYETRINGEAVDPQKFLRAGVRLGSL